MVKIFAKQDVMSAVKDAARFFDFMRVLGQVDMFAVREKRHNKFNQASGVWECENCWSRDKLYSSQDLLKNFHAMLDKNLSDRPPVDYFFGFSKNCSVPPIWCIDLDGGAISPDEQIQRMRRDGFTPIAVVASSPCNRQVWLYIQGYTNDELNRDNCRQWREVQDALVKKYGGDNGSKGPWHLFRLPFTGLKNHKSIRQKDGSVIYKYSQDFVSWSETAMPVDPPKSPSRETIESWPEYSTRGGSSYKNNVTAETPPCRGNTDINAVELSESFWKNTWTKKRNEIICEIEDAMKQGIERIKSYAPVSAFIRMDGSIDDSRLDLEVAGRKLRWYSENRPDAESIRKAAHSLELCLARQVMEDPDRSCHKDAAQYARRTMQCAFDITIRSQKRRGNIRVARLLEDAREWM